MKYSILLFILLLGIGCSAKHPPAHEAEIITRLGIIAAREDVSLDQVEKDTNVNTSIYASVSSGGRVSFGLGILLYPFTSGSSRPDPVRYQINLQDGGQMTIYHDSRDFAVDDCVEIRVHPDEKNHPPTMKRNQGACQ